jgi:hypothetical protein
MATLDVLHGKNGAIYVDGTKIANKAEWNLQMNRDYADVTTFRDGNKTYAAGLRDLQGSFSGLYDTSEELAISKSDGVAYTVQVWAEDQVTLVGEGPAYLDASVTASVSDAVRCTGNFRAAGTWTIT